MTDQTLPVKVDPERLLALQERAYEILTHPEQTVWTTCGLGFMRSYLDDEANRLHIWDRRLVVSGVTAIHDHPWDFTSTVLQGIIQNSRGVLGDEKPWSQPYYMATIVTGTGSGADQYEPVRLSFGRTESYSTGAIYHQSAGEIHETIASQAITYMERTLTGQKTGRCFWHRGAQYVSPAPRLSTEVEIDTILSAAAMALRRAMEAGGGKS